MLTEISLQRDALDCSDIVLFLGVEMKGGPKPVGGPTGFQQKPPGRIRQKNPQIQRPFYKYISIELMSFFSLDRFFYAIKACYTVFYDSSMKIIDRL